MGPLVGNRQDDSSSTREKLPVVIWGARNVDQSPHRVRKRLTGKAKSKKNESLQLRSTNLVPAAGGNSHCGDGDAGSPEVSRGNRPHLAPARLALARALARRPAAPVHPRRHLPWNAVEPAVAQRVVLSKDLAARQLHAEVVVGLIGPCGQDQARAWHIQAVQEAEGGGCILQNGAHALRLDQEGLEALAVLVPFHLPAGRFEQRHSVHCIHQHGGTGCGTVETPAAAPALQGLRPHVPRAAPAAEGATHGRQELEPHAAHEVAGPKDAQQALRLQV